MAHKVAQVSEADQDEQAPRAGSWLLPAIAASILTLLWGAYTVFVVIEVASSPLPPAV